MALHSGIERARLLSVLALAAGIAAGCGSSSPSAPPGISLSLTAPSYHATVGVPTIDVLGSVDPGTAVVRVNHARARVAQGAFNSPVTLHRGLNRIRIVATADGFKQATVSLKLRYHPRAGANPLPAVHHRSSPSGAGEPCCAVADGASSCCHRDHRDDEVAGSRAAGTDSGEVGRAAGERSLHPGQGRHLRGPDPCVAARIDADSRELDDIQAGDLSGMTARCAKFERLASKVNPIRARSAAASVRALLNPGERVIQHDPGSAG